jgi:hypothetical protein
MLKKIFILLLFSTSILLPQNQKILKPSIDDNSKYTNIGNMSLTVSNFGMFGHGFKLWPQQPSCQYPKGSGIEHLWGAGLWVGAMKNGQISVSTGADLAPSVSGFYVGAEGYEYTNNLSSIVIEKSSLPDSRFYTLDAVSHQDFIADFTDANQIIPGTTNVIPKHDYPLNITVHQETYAWNFSFADNFVILNFWIKNSGKDLLENVYIGLWADPVIRNTNVTPPTVGSPFYTHAGNGYIDSMKMSYTFDYDGDPGLTDSYLGMKILGTSPIQKNTIYNSWGFHNTSDPVFFAPADDIARYQKLSGGLLPNDIATLRLQGKNALVLLSTGPFTSIKPGDSVNFVVGLICAKKSGTSPASMDLFEQESNLIMGANWAQKAYNGEDRNNNGLQDPDEIWTNGGKPRRYFLPAPPNPPRVKIIPDNQKVILYWDKIAEESVDPISNKKDFEGYRIYGTNPGHDLSEAEDVLGSLILLGEFDRSDDDVSYNTGFGKIKMNQPQKFPGDTVSYWYKFEVPNCLNGWQYIYTVTAFDSGDPTINLESLESSKIQNLTRVVPGTLPLATSTQKVSVYPNPYYANAYWDGRTERDRKLYFNNLPANCIVRVYTLSGDLVDEFEHHSNYSGNDINWFHKYSDGSQIMTGGEHAWDLISKNDQAIATGLYLFTVKNLQNNEIVQGKFLIIK